MEIKYEINMNGRKIPLTGTVYLAPCPFCDRTEGLELLNTHTPSTWVECSCGAQMHGGSFSPANGIGTRKHFKAAIEATVRAWNKREEIDRTKACLEDIGAYCGRPMDKTRFGECSGKDVEQLLRDILKRVKFGLQGA